MRARVAQEARYLGILLGFWIFASGGASAQSTIILDEVSIEGDTSGPKRQSLSGDGAGQPPPTGTIGQPPPPYAGGQVATGGRVGFLGNRSVFDTPFTQNNYTDQVIRDQQALTVTGVFDNDPAVRQVQSPFSIQPNIYIRGFLLNAREFAFDGLYGIVSVYRPAIEGIERIEVLNGPGAFLFGFPPSGNVGGVVNFVPKRAPDVPITRLTAQYLSDSNVGGTFDVARRFGDGNSVGIRINGAYREGQTPIDRQTERFGVVSLGLDYRGERLRLSADAGYQNIDARAQVSGFGVLSGFAIPRAPSLTNNVQNSWEYFNSSVVFATGRAEYDLTPDVTVFGAIGGSTNNADGSSTFPTIIDAAGTLSQLTFARTLSSQDQFTAETGIRARFTTGFIDHSAAVVGTHYDSPTRYVFAFGPTFTSNLYNPTFAPRPFVPPSSILPRTKLTTELDGIAVTDTMSILDGRVQVIAGGRFQEVKTGTVDTTGTQVAPYDKGAATPLAAVIVKPLQNLSLYASYAEGFGFGPQAPANAVNANALFPPTITTQIETGAKLDFGRLGATLALYEITQPSAFLDPATRVFGPSGEQRNRGMDLNVFGEPTPGLRVLGGVTLLDGVLTKTAGGTFDGNVAPGVPNVQLNIGGEVDLPPWMLPGLTLFGRVIYTTKQFYDLANTQSIPDYARLDLGLRYRFAIEGTPVVARFNVLNATGVNYWGSTGQGQLQLGQPQTFLFSLSADL